MQEKDKCLQILLILSSVIIARKVRKIANRVYKYKIKLKIGDKMKYILDIIAAC